MSTAGDNTLQLIRFDQLKSGVPHRLEHDQKGVLLCRINNEVFAVHDTCTHEDISLSLGVLCEYRLRCPLHGSEFDVRSGKVLDEPADTDLATYPVYIKDEWVCIDSNK